jgi:PAS domain S-box-containing protein
MRFFLNTTHHVRQEKEGEMMAFETNDKSAVTEMYDPIFQVAGIGLALLDFEGHFLRVNPALQALFGIPETELRGKRLYDYCSGADAVTCFDMIHELSLGSGSAQDQEFNLKCRNGRSFWVHITASRLNGGGSLPSCIVLTVHDSSDYFELQEEMKSHLECLDGKPSQASLCS